MAGAPRILTIEDEPWVREGIVAFLEDSGFAMLQAQDGASGLEVFRKERPDAVLCDLRLPGVDGLEVVATISRESPDTPVIVVSGVNLLGDAVQAMKRGAWDYITKPIHDLGILEHAVQSVLQRAELARQNREYQQQIEAMNRELSSTLQRLQADEEAARRLQFQLLPEDGRRIGAYLCSRRLFPSMYLSGDFVDYFALDSRHLGFYLADVSGHGAASSFLTVMLRTLMAQYREALWQDRDETILHPDRTLLRLHRDLSQQRLDQHLSILYGVIDGAENAAACSTGGHFPHPILHDGQSGRYLRCRGQPVGLFSNPSFPLARVPLPPSFTLVLVSDGVLELLPMHSLAEKQAALLERVRPGIGIDRFVDSLGVEKAERLPDDIAVLMIQRPSHVER